MKTTEQKQTSQITEDEIKRMGRDHAFYDGEYKPLESFTKEQRIIYHNAWNRGCEDWHNHIHRKL